MVLMPGGTSPRAERPPVRNQDDTTNEVTASTTHILDIREEVEPVDPFLAELRATGLPEEKIARLMLLQGQKRRGRGQKRLPLAVAVCSPERVAYYAGQSDERIELSMVLGIRTDDGPQGSVASYRELLKHAGVPSELATKAAESIASNVQHRVWSIRESVVATTNELRRRRAADPTTAKYLKVADAPVAR
jgi:hypothetical protein